MGDSKDEEYQLTLLANLSTSCYLGTLNESAREQKAMKYVNVAPLCH